METKPSHQEIETKTQRLYLEVLDRVVSDEVWQSDQAPQHKGNLATTLNTTHSCDGLAKAKDYALATLRTNLDSCILGLRELSRTAKVQNLPRGTVAVERNLILNTFQESIDYLVYFLINKSRLSRQQIEGELQKLI